MATTKTQVRVLLMAGRDPRRLWVAVRRAPADSHTGLAPAIGAQVCYSQQYMQQVRRCAGIQARVYDTGITTILRIRACK